MEWSEGNKIRLEQFGLEIWLPKGWKVQIEQGQEPAPMCYREVNSIGTLRLTATRIDSSPTRRYEPQSIANDRATRLRKTQSVHDVKTESTLGNHMVAYTTDSQESTPQGLIPVRTHLWETYEPKGVVVSTFTYAKKMESDKHLRDELVAVREIVARINHL